MRDGAEQAGLGVECLVVVLCALLRGLRMVRTAPSGVICLFSTLATSEIMRSMRWRPSQLSSLAVTGMTVCVQAARALIMMMPADGGQSSRT